MRKKERKEEVSETESERQRDYFLHHLLQFNIIIISRAVGHFTLDCMYDLYYGRITCDWG